MEHVDVAVVGAGPAGVAAALTLARAGRDTVVIDKAMFPRDKFCGDGLTTGALRLLEELGLRPEAVRSWQPVRDIEIHSPAGRTVALPLPPSAGQYAAVARRMDLDAALVDLVRATGARLWEATAMTAARPSGDTIELCLKDREPISASHVIGADGMWSPLRKALGIGPPSYLGEWHTFRQYFHDVDPRSHDAIHVFFERDLLPGYAWCFPLPDGRSNVGFGIRRDQGSPTGSMKRLWPELLHRPSIRGVLGESAEPEGPHRAWPIPAAIGRMPLWAGRALFAGDAAAVTDPLTGEGIGQALVSGVQAAEAIVARAPDPADVGAHYERAIARDLTVDHRLAGALSGALRSTRATELAIRTAGFTDWTRRNFARWLFEDYPRAILATPRRWRRGMLTGSGAYQSTV